MTAAHQGRVGWIRTSGLIIAIAVLVGGSAAAAGAQPADNAPRPPRIRALDERAAALLTRGTELSPAFAHLVEIVEQSDLVVFVDTGLLQIPGHLRFAGTTPCGRLVRITINVLDHELHRIAALGHELQHAVEIAQSSGITDSSALVRFYETHGFRKPRGGYCTRAADRMTVTVRTEVCQAASQAGSR